MHLAVVSAAGPSEPREWLRHGTVPFRLGGLHLPRKSFLIPLQPLSNKAKNKHGFKAWQGMS